MLKKIFACGSALIIGLALFLTPVYAGTSPSNTVLSYGTDSLEVCEPKWEASMNKATIWSRTGEITWYVSSDDMDSIEDFTMRWENLTGDEIRLDPSRYSHGMMFVVPEETSLDNADPGAYLFLYDDAGCFVDVVVTRAFNPDDISSKKSDSLFQLMDLENDSSMAIFSGYMDLVRPRGIQDVE